MNLKQLYNTLESVPVNCRAIHEDSRLLLPNGFFLLHERNLQFLTQAIESEISYIICCNKFVQKIQDVSGKAEIYSSKLETDKIGIIPIDDDLFDIGKILAIFYQKTSPNIAAVTGTNGKTSTVSFVRQMLKEAGKECISIENTDIVLSTGVKLNFGHGLTTPSICDVHKIFHIGATRYATEYGILEASSHGIHQDRLSGTKIKVAAFTQLTQDHLDYHLTMEEYFKVKKTLFSKYLSEDGVAVINADVEQFMEIDAICKQRKIKVISYGETGVEVKLLKETIEPNSQEIVIKILDEEYIIKTDFFGSFQTKNILCAIGILLAFGINPKKFMKQTLKLKTPKGRMENVQTTNCLKSNIYIDYAHTPGALQVVIESLRRISSKKGRIIVVIGCGGDRDATKRPLIGDIAAQYADIVIITNDNPRHEDPSKIRMDILSGVKKELLSKTITIESRREAIQYAIETSREEDIVLIAGKGHETVQIVGSKRIPFNDKTVAEEILLEIKLNNR